LQQVGGVAGVSPRVQAAPAPDPVTNLRPAAFLSGDAALPPSRHRRKVSPRPLGHRLVLGAFTVLTTALVLSLLVGRGGAAALLRLPGADRLLAWSGLGIEQVSVSGHRFTPDADIFDAIDLAGSASLLSFDSAQARARIERLPWVASARISRVFPGSLDVRIRERSPAALWTHGDGDYLIDADGRVLAAVEPGMSTSLPHVAGKGASSQARSLIDLVKHYPRIAERFERAERVGERRWTLQLKGGITLHLAADREAAAFAALSSPDDLGRLLSAHNVTIDLRTPGRVTVRPDPRRAQAPAASTPQSQARS